MIKSECTALLHKQGLKVDVVEYHDRVIKRLDMILEAQK
jgi:pyruvate/2-oxoglutarate dehydrogenase complex dihydrolipoamide dehydrogenase (E3) component